MYQAATQVLEKLPSVFEKDDVQALLLCSDKAVSVYLNRWKAKGLISSAGQRSGVHFNRYKFPLMEDEMYWEAVARKTDEFAPINLSRLIEKGWLERVSEKPFQSFRVLVPSGTLMASYYDIDVFHRPRRHYTKIGKFQTLGKNRWFELRLTEACILADLTVMESTDWKIHHDRLPENVQQGLEKVLEALKKK